MFDSPLGDYVLPYSYDPAVAELQKAAMAIGLARREVDYSRLIGTYVGLGDSDILTKGFSHVGWITIHHEAPTKRGRWSPTSAWARVASSPRVPAT